MALERRDPLPIGRYSVFILPKEASTWSEWIKRHGSSVKVIAVVDHTKLASSTPIFSANLELELIKDYAGSSVLFDVTAPTAWVGLGLPTIENVSIESWTASERPTPSVEPDVFDEVKSILLLGGALYFGAVLALHALSKGKS